MRAFLLALTVALMLASAGAAQTPRSETPPPESVTLELMKQYCFPFRGQPGQTLAAADAAGWAPASRKVAPQAPVDIDDQAFRFRSTRKAASYLFAGVGPSPYDPAMKVSYCGISSLPESHKQTLKVVEAWVGAPAREVTDEGRIYAFVFEADGSRRDADPQGAVFGRALVEGRAGILVLAGDEEGVFLMLLTANRILDA